MTKTEMGFKIPGYLFFACLFTAVPLSAQDSIDSNVELEEVSIERKLLPYNNPMFSGESELGRNDQQEIREVDDLQKGMMREISKIYALQVKAINAQVEDDALKAEEYINEALAGLRRIMDEHPEAEDNRRFNELYRSVVAEYREFYALGDPADNVEGEVFEVREELFSEEDDWMVEGYELPDDIPLNTSSGSVPLVQNEQVNRHLMYYTMRRPEVVERWLERSKRYFPMMKKIFREEGAPEELIHLSMIESGLNPVARSWASAVGMWQFISATGSMYGLEINWWVDERRDPEKATRAAARHLKDLHGIWDDWHLAMANYNISPRGLKRAINAAGGVEDYWTAYPYLPRETRGYVPGFIAATMITSNPTEFGFDEEYEAEPYDYEVAEVDPLMPLDKLAEAAGISLSELKEYNPELLRWATPPGDKYPLKLPVDTKERFVAEYEKIPQEDRSEDIEMHTVQSGESLGSIASRYGTSVRALYEMNENISRVIYPGQKIVIPLPEGSESQIAANRPSNSSTQPTASAASQTRSSTSSSSSSGASAPANSASVSYTVKSGDTVGHVAEWFDIRSWQVRGWNNISNTIRPGQTLTIYVPAQKQNYYQKIDEMSFAEKQELEREQRSGKDITELVNAGGDNSGFVQYEVQQNDTLVGIASSFGVSVEQIRELNNINGSHIYVGQTLRINRSD